MESKEKPKVLVVDDEKSICQSVHKILSRHGFEVEEALNAREGLAKLAAEPKAFGTVLVDLMMPQVSGAQLLQAIHKQYPTLPVVIITGYASIQSAVETAKLGAFEYLPKPFTPHELSDVTERAIMRYYEEVERVLHKAREVQPEKEARRERRTVDVDQPFDEEELRAATSATYVESIGHDEIPRLRLAADYCPVGKRSCARFERLGACKGECPLDAKATQKAAVSAEELLEDVESGRVLDVDLPFDPVELALYTCPEYVNALGRSGMPLVGKWHQVKKPEKRVLVVDDEPSVCQSVAKILARYGFEVEESLNGKDALERFKQQRYDLVLLDLKLPEVEGPEVLRRIKQERPEQKVVIITGYASIPSAVESIREGADNYIAKPFTPRELVAATVEAVG